MMLRRIAILALVLIPAACVSNTETATGVVDIAPGVTLALPKDPPFGEDVHVVRRRETVESLEHFTATVEGSVLTARDINYWGLTVGSDDRTVYATLASGGFTWLVKGDLAAKTVTSLRRDAECPSLSPDGTKVAYKKRIGRLGPWDLAVLDLAANEEKRLPGTAGVDDQATWLGESELAFAAVPKDAKLPAVHVVPADGSQPAKVLIPDATSPSPVT